ncbi:MAG: archaeal heat shock protein Hsp20 [Candidatus Hodarchaeales archaeon]|jgi:HSP20 family protein
MGNNGRDSPYGSDFNEFIRKIQKLMEDFLQNMDLGEDLEDIFEDLGRNPFVMGFSFNKDPDGKLHFERFGNFIKQFGFGAPNQFNKREKENQAREPLVDVIKEDEEVHVIVEMPGVDKKSIDLRTTEMTLKIMANFENRRYRKHIDFPCPIIPESAKATFKNGILEIIFKRPEIDKSTKIDIE